MSKQEAKPSTEKPSAFKSTFTKVRNFVTRSKQKTPNNLNEPTRHSSKKIPEDSIPAQPNDAFRQTREDFGVYYNIDSFTPIPPPRFKKNTRQGTSSGTKDHSIEMGYVKWTPRGEESESVQMVNKNSEARGKRQILPSVHSLLPKQNSREETLYISEASIKLTQKQVQPLGKKEISTTQNHEIFFENPFSTVHIKKEEQQRLDNDLVNHPAYAAQDIYGSSESSLNKINFYDTPREQEQQNPKKNLVRQASDQTEDLQDRLNHLRISNQVISTIQSNDLPLGDLVNEISSFGTPTHSKEEQTVGENHLSQELTQADILVERLQRLRLSEPSNDQSKMSKKRTSSEEPPNPKRFEGSETNNLAKARNFELGMQKNQFHSLNQQKLRIVESTSTQEDHQTGWYGNAENVTHQNLHRDQQKGEHFKNDAFASYQNSQKIEVRRKSTEEVFRTGNFSHSSKSITQSTEIQSSNHHTIDIPELPNSSSYHLPRNQQIQNIHGEPQYQNVVPQPVEALNHTVIITERINDHSNHDQGYHHQKRKSHYENVHNKTLNSRDNEVLLKPPQEEKENMTQRTKEIVGQAKEANVIDEKEENAVEEKGINITDVKQKNITRQNEENFKTEGNAKVKKEENGKVTKEENAADRKKEDIPEIRKERVTEEEVKNATIGVEEQVTEQKVENYVNNQEDNAPQAKEEKEINTNNEDVKQRKETLTETEKERILVDEKQKFVQDTLYSIKSILKDIEELEKEMQTFPGVSADHRDYMYMDELMMRNLIKLDNIETKANQEVRQARKNGIQYIQSMLKKLDAKLKENQRQAAEIAAVKAQNEDAEERRDDLNVTEIVADKSRKDETVINAEDS